MGKRLENWLSKAITENTRGLWSRRWRKFANWVVTTKSPLTGRPYLECGADQVDEVVRSDFESMPFHIFQDKYRNILDVYVASLKSVKSNTLLSYVSTVRSFFGSEAAEIKLQKGRLPSPELAESEHRFTQDEFRRMWAVGGWEDKARLSTAISLGWSIGDFLLLERRRIEDALENVDEDGYAHFETKRKKTHARTFAILNPCAIEDLKHYLATDGASKGRGIWTTTTDVGINAWFKSLFKQAGLRNNGTVRFHLIRKYVFDTVTATCGMEEAKLLVGKTVPASELTYLHGLSDRLLERYKRHAYPLLALNGARAGQEKSLKSLEEKLDSQSKIIGEVTLRNELLTDRLARIESELRERKVADPALNALFSDPEIQQILLKKLKELKT